MKALSLIVVLLVVTVSTILHTAVLYFRNTATEVELNAYIIASFALILITTFVILVVTYSKSNK